MATFVQEVRVYHDGGAGAWNSVGHERLITVETHAASEMVLSYNTCTMKHFKYRVSGILARMGWSALWPRYSIKRMSRLASCAAPPCPLSEEIRGHTARRA